MLYLFLKIIIKNIIKNIMENIKLNKEQEKIINNFVNKNACFVNASAGTGKTTTITEVYIKLLESGEKVSNIIVITFTKAAANEMLLKIRNRIRKKINEENINKNYWQNIYKELLSNSKISTISSFFRSQDFASSIICKICFSISFCISSLTSSIFCGATKLPFPCFVTI